MDIDFQNLFVIVGMVEGTASMVGQSMVDDMGFGFVAIDSGMLAWAMRVVLLDSNQTFGKYLFD